MNTQFDHVIAETIERDGTRMMLLTQGAESTLQAAAREALAFARENPDQTVLLQKPGHASSFDAHGLYNAPHHRRGEINVSALVQKMSGATEVDVIKQFHASASAVRVR